MSTDSFKLASFSVFKSLKSRSKLNDEHFAVNQVEMQSDQLEEIREKWRSTQEYNKESDKRFDSLERYVHLQLIL